VQVYEQLDGNSDEMFSPKAGLLLDMRLHRAYDALNWSLYRKVRKHCVPTLLPALTQTDSEERHILRPLLLPDRPLETWVEWQSDSSLEIPRARRGTRPSSSRLALRSDSSGAD